MAPGRQKTGLSETSVGSGIVDRLAGILGRIDRVCGILAHAFLRACWAEDKDIAEDGVVRACLEEAGFDPGLADSGLLKGAEIYAANLEEAAARGVFGAPFYITEDDQRFWGQDRLDDLDAFLESRAA